MFKNYLKVALRILAKNKSYSFINIIGLSVGVACCMLIFLYTKDELSFDHFHKNNENIYRITAEMVSPGGETSYLGSTGMMPGPVFKKAVPEIQEFVRIQYANFNVKTNAEVVEQEALWADENLFSVFSFPLLYGNPKTVLTGLHSVVLSEELAEKYFGKKNVVGQTLQLNADKTFETFVVTGVAKSSPQNSSIKLQMILPMALSEKINHDTQWMNYFLNTFVVLKPGSNIATVESKMTRAYTSDAAATIKMMAEEYGYKEKTNYHLQPFLQMHLNTELPADNGLVGASDPVYSYILSGIAAFILIIASINFVNLTVARSLKRAREIGMRKVVGGSRKQLIIQFLGESFVLSFLAFTLACLLTWMVLPFFNTLANKELSFSYLFDTKLVLGYTGLFLITGLLAGFYPALVLSHFRPVDTLYGKFSLKGKNYLSGSLVVFQFTLSTFLIIATITIYSQFNYLLGFDLGYDKTNVLSLATGKIDAKQFNFFKQELLKSPAIKEVTGNQGGNWNTAAHINGENEIAFNYKYIDGDYFHLFKIPVIKGRNFSGDFPSDTSESVVINEAFVKKAGWKEPLGQIVDFYYNNKKYKVIGVIKDYHFASLTEEVQPQLFTTRPIYQYGLAYIKVQPGKTSEALSHITNVFHTTFPAQPYKYSFEDEEVRGNYEQEAKWKQIIGFAALLTIFISCIGLFGLATLSAEKRAREIGIRKVLGASVSSITKKLSLNFIKLVFIAACVSLPVAWWVMNKWLQNYPYRIKLNFPLFISAVMVVLIVALLTVAFQSIKAAMANPVKNLRSE